MKEATAIKEKGERLETVLLVQSQKGRVHHETSGTKDETNSPMSTTQWLCGTGRKAGWRGCVQIDAHRLVSCMPWEA